MVCHPEKSGACLESTHFVSETTKVASPQVPVDSLPVKSGACLEPTFFYAKASNKAVPINAAVGSCRAVVPVV